MSMNLHAILPSCVDTIASTHPPAACDVVGSLAVCGVCVWGVDDVRTALRRERKDIPHWITALR